MSLLKKSWKEVDGFCSLCNVKIKNKKNWKQHLDTKKHMKKENNLINDINEEDIKYSCKTCDKKYKHSSSLRRHRKKCKKIKKENTVDNSINITGNDNNLNVTNNNITNNNTINIIIRPYGEENYKNAIPFDKIEEMVAKIYRLNDTSFLYEKLYEEPPNNNASISDLARSEHCDVYSDNGSLKKRFTDTVIQYKINNFAQNVEDLTKDYFNSKPRTYDYNVLRNAFEKQARFELHDKKELKKKIKLSLYNNRKNLEKFQ